MRRAHSKVSGFGPHGVAPMVWSRREAEESTVFVQLSTRSGDGPRTPQGPPRVTRRKRGGRSGIVFGHQARSEGQLDQPGALLILRQVLDPEFLEKCA